MLNLLKLKQAVYNFSDQHVQDLNQLSLELGDLLIKAGHGTMVDYLTETRLAAERRDSDLFEKKVLCNELFGSFGAIWEICHETQELRNAFCAFADLLVDMGIKNARVNQVRRSFRT